MRGADVGSARRSCLWRRLSAAAVLLAACLFGPVRAAHSSGWIAFNDPPVSGSQPNSILLFGGRMSTSNFGGTLVFNTFPVDTGLLGPLHYDNYIVGAAYDRDVYRFGSLVVGGEVGIADRFGNYRRCCAPQVIASGLLNSGEFWFGPSVHYDGFVLFDRLRVSPGITVGFSLTTNSIGTERQREISDGGNARLLGYLGPEIAFSTIGDPRLELVIKVQPAREDYSATSERATTPT